MAGSAIGVLVLVVAFIGGLFWLVVTFAGWVSAMALAFVVISIMLMLAILVQQPKGGGLAGAFGGSGGSQGAVMGAKAGDMLTYATVVLFVMFLGSLLGLTAVIRATEAPDDTDEETIESNDATGEGTTTDDNLGVELIEDGAPATDGSETIGDTMPKAEVEDMPAAGVDVPDAAIPEGDVMPEDDAAMPAPDAGADVSVPMDEGDDTIEPDAAPAMPE